MRITVYKHLPGNMTRPVNYPGISFHTSPKTIRGRIMVYLSSVSLKKGSSEFDIPFDRQQLADYLNLERSALSKELGKMKKDGLIEVRKSHYKSKSHFSSEFISVIVIMIQFITGRTSIHMLCHIRVIPISVANPILKIIIPNNGSFCPSLL